MQLYKFPNCTRSLLIIFRFVFYTDAGSICHRCIIQLGEQRRWKRKQLPLSPFHDSDGSPPFWSGKHHPAGNGQDHNNIFDLFLIWFQTLHSWDATFHWYRRNIPIHDGELASLRILWFLVAAPTCLLAAWNIPCIHAAHSWPVNIPCVIQSNSCYKIRIRK